MYTKFNIVFLLFVTIFILHSRAISQNSANLWSGWRGLEKEGRCENSKAPVSWSAKKNIVWETPIPGSGHSSPVVYGNNVIVTTAYHTEKNKFVNSVFSYSIFGIIVFIFLLFIEFFFHIWRQKTIFSLQQVISFWTFSITLGFIVYFSLTGIIFPIADNADHITQSTRWYFTGIIFSLCIIVSTFSISLTTKNKIFLSLLLILSSAFIFFFRPAPEYYTITNDGSLSNAMHNAIIIPLIIAVIIIVSIYIKKPFFQEQSRKKNTPHILGKLVFIISLIGAFIVGFYGIGIYRFLRYSLPEKIYSFPVLDIYYRDSNVFTTIVFICLVLWSSVYIVNNYANYIYKSRAFTICIVVLAFLVFIKKNYFVVENEFVRAIICIDSENGKVKWTRELFQGIQMNIHPDNSPATPSPIITENRIYAYFGTPGLVCADTLGIIIWENKNIPFEDIHGIGASPLLYKDCIIILNDMPKAPYITSIDCKTGKEKWKTMRKPWEGFHGSHRTPTLIKIQENDYIITWGFYGINIYDVTNGKELNFYPLDNSIGQLVASILTNGDTIYAPDRDKFHAFSISKLFQGENPIIWETTMNHKGPVCSSPVFFNNMLFMISDNGYASCLNAHSGKLIWREKLNGIFLASAILIGQNILFSNTSGITTVIAAEKKFNTISKNIVPTGIYASIAPVQDKIFIRTTEKLYCIKEN